jgi:hypothetical protein
VRRNPDGTLMLVNGAEHGKQGGLLIAVAGVLLGALLF